ncbi:MAG: sulfatase [Myxococcota bacterium]
MRDGQRIALGLAAVGLLACAPDPEPGNLRRAFAGSGVLAAPVEVDGITRDALRLTLTEGVRVELPLGSVPRGRLQTTVAAVDNSGSGSLRLTLEGPRRWLGLQPGFETHCELRWPLADEANPWQRCDFAVTEALPEATLQIETAGLTGTEIALSDPLLLPADAPTRPNVFVLLADTARADRFELFGGELPIGEHLAALGADGIVFEAARAPSSWTRPSTASLLSGLTPSSHRVFGRLDSLPENVETLAEVLQRAGYATHAWSSNPNVLPLFGFGQGFDIFEDVGARHWGGAKADASQLVDRVIETLDSGAPEPGFHYVHFMDPHAPYQPPEAIRQAIDALEGVDETFPGMRGIRPAAEEAYRAYLGELLDFDTQVGRLVAALKARGLYENSLIVVTSDHGEEFLDHGYGSHGHGLFEELLRVPLVLKLPGNQAAESVAARVALEDVVPSLLAILGIDPPAGVEGRSTLASGGTAVSDDRPFVATLRLDGRNQSAIVVGDWKLILYAVSGFEKLYDLGADPGEKQNLASGHPEKVAELRAALEWILASRDAGWHVRACGTDRLERLELGLSPAVEVRRLYFEAADFVATEPGSAETAVTFELVPGVRSRAIVGPVDEVYVRDVDEIVVHAPDFEAAPLRLVVRGRDAIDLQVGNEDGFESVSAVDFRGLQERARVSALERIRCAYPGDGKPEHPTLRIWYIEGPESISESAIDPATRERLRALGYEW